MKRFLMAGVMTLGLFSAATLVAAADKAESISGVLIDEKCGKGKDEAGAGKHPKACTIKCAGGGEALLLVSGDKSYKLDADSAKKAKEFLDKADSTTKVTVEATKSGDTLTITSIKATEAKKG